MDAEPDTGGWSTVSDIIDNVERLTVFLDTTLVVCIKTLQPFDGPLIHVLDLGCGSGALTSVLKQVNPDMPVTAIDATQRMITMLERRAEVMKWTNVTMQHFDADAPLDLKTEMFSHTMSSFMICSAPEPDLIAEEMYRVTKFGGTLGLAVWGDPFMNCLNGPWTAACRQCMPDYEPVQIMSEMWTSRDRMEKRLREIGWNGIHVEEHFGCWHWENVGALSMWFFHGSNQGNQRMIKSFTERGGDISAAMRGFENLVKEQNGRKDGHIELEALAILSTAWK